MEYLEGQDLRTILQERLFTSDEIFRMMQPVMDTLEKIHATGVIHRDISPDNLMLLKDGRLKLMDFGSARMVDYSDQKSLSVVLKAGFAPEEQYRSNGKQGPWTDIYSLCATIYKCITGITPDDALDRGYEDSIQWPSELGIPISVQQEAVLRKGMAYRQDNRFQNIAEMRQALMLSSSIPEHPRSVSGIAYGAQVNYGQGRDDATEYLPDYSFDVGNYGMYDPRVPNYPPDVPNVSEIDKQKPVENIHTKRRIPPIIVVIVAVLAVAGMAFWAAGGINRVPTDPDLIYDVTLEVPEDMSTAEYRAAQKILRGRLNTFAGRGYYRMDVHDDSIALIIPRDVFGDVELSKALACYISRATELYAYDYWGGDYIHIARDDLAKVTQKSGTIEGVDASDYGINEVRYDYLEVVLTNECAQRLKDEIEVWGDDLRFAQDIESVSNWYYHYTFPAGDGKTFYILNNDLGGRYVEIVRYNLTHDPYSSNFYYTINSEDYN